MNLEDIVNASWKIILRNQRNDRLLPSFSSLLSSCRCNFINQKAGQSRNIKHNADAIYHDNFSYTQRNSLLHEQFSLITLYCFPQQSMSQVFTKQFKDSGEFHSMVKTTIPSYKEKTLRALFTSTRNSKYKLLKLASLNKKLSVK